MKAIIVLILASLLVFGCLGIGGTPASHPAGNGSAKGTGGTQGAGTGGQQAAACTPAYSFSDLAAGVLSKTSHLAATATCAAGKRMVVKLDGTEAAAASPAGNDTSPLDFAIAPKKDGTVKLTVESDGTTVLSRDWEVAPLGSSDTRGLETDAISFKEWRGVAFAVENQMTVDKVRMFLKRLASTTQPGTNLVLELRTDSAGNPGAVIASVKRPVNVTTLSDNWIPFEFAEKPVLAPGTYWAVLKVEQTEDVSLVSDAVYLHYVTVDKQAPGNAYTRQMLLSVESRTGVASETAWTPLAYDRTYAVTIHGAG